MSFFLYGIFKPEKSKNNNPIMPRIIDITPSAANMPPPNTSLLIFG